MADWLIHDLLFSEFIFAIIGSDDNTRFILCFFLCVPFDVGNSKSNKFESFNQQVLPKLPIWIGI